MRKLFNFSNRKLAQNLGTQRFLLKSIGPLEALRVTDKWRTDPEFLLSTTRSSKPPSILRWIRSGPIPNNSYRFTWSIIPKGTDIPIGVHVVRLGGGHQAASMTIVIHDREWWGKGVVVEVRAKILNHVFANSSIDRIIGSVNGRNIPSIFNYKRLGFDTVGTLRRQNCDPVTGELIDVVMFELLKEKWETGPYADRKVEA